MKSSRRNTAFTLVELLVVLAIMGLVAALAVPAIKNFGHVDEMSAATRQLMDDVSLARQLAIAGRTDVYMVFVPPGLGGALNNLNPYSPADRQVLLDLANEQFTGYALFARHQVGDQPGRPTARYLTPWRSMPEGTLIATNKFSAPPGFRAPAVNGVSPFLWDARETFPFPTVNSPPVPLPYIEFNYLGQVVGARDGGTEIIPVARGSVLAGSVREVPAGNSITASNHIRIDGLTGRPHVERFQIQ